jgi:hypothetical protein
MSTYFMAWIPLVWPGRFPGQVFTRYGAGDDEKSTGRPADLDGNGIHGLS